MSTLDLALACVGMLLLGYLLGRYAPNNPFYTRVLLLVCFVAIALITQSPLGLALAVITFGVLMRDKLRSSGN